MTDDEKRQSETDSDLERQIRATRKFTAKEAMARLAGPGAMKGASPISPVQQAETEIGNWLGDNLDDASGALKVVVHRNLKGSAALLDNLERPLFALTAYCQAVLQSDYLLQEIVRAADIEWGRAMGERPHFEREGTAPDPNDPYTSEKVRNALDGALKLLPGEKDQPTPDQLNS